MPSVTKRKVIKFGENGLVITIPKPWANYYQLKPGDKVTLIANKNLIVKVEK